MQHGHHAHERRSHRAHTCEICGERRALAWNGRRRVAMRGHGLCDRCWRMLLDRAQGERLGEVPSPQVQAA
jgi:hypothetical protein